MKPKFELDTNDWIPIPRPNYRTPGSIFDIPIHEIPGPKFSSPKPEIPGPNFKTSGNKFETPRLLNQIPRPNNLIPRPNYQSTGPNYQSTGPNYQSTGPNYNTFGPNSRNRGSSYNSRGPNYGTRRQNKRYWRPNNQIPHYPPNYGTAGPNYNSNFGTPVTLSNYGFLNFKIPNLNVGNVESTDTNFNAEIVNNYMQSRADIGTQETDIGTTKSDLGAKKADLGTRENDFGTSETDIGTEKTVLGTQEADLENPAPNPGTQNGTRELKSFQDWNSFDVGINDIEPTKGVQSKRQENKNTLPLNRHFSETPDMRARHRARNEEGRAKFREYLYR